MIAFQAFNDALRKGLLFAGSEWLLRAIEAKNERLSIYLAYSVLYQLKAENAHLPGLDGQGLAQLEEVYLSLN